MAPRAIWKGLLQISRVTIPIKIAPATESSAALSFNQLHGVCQTRMQQKRWCPKCNREVASADIVKGFEFERGRYVILLEDELAAIHPASSKVIDLVQFADEALLHPLFIDRSYYLTPEGPTAAEAFVLMRDAMVGQVGIGKLALYGREYLVAVRPHAFTLLLHTLHHAAEIRAIDVVEDLGDALTASPEASALKAARQLIATLHGPLRLGDFTDEYRADTQRLIDAKIDGLEFVEPAPVERPPVANLREALTLSLAVSGKKTPAKASTTQRRKTRVV